MKTEDKVNLIAKVACDKKADNIVILDMNRPSQLCDFFVIASGSSTRQVRAIADSIEEKVRQEGMRNIHIEGYTEGAWILLDLRDVVVHVFTQEMREFYDLERLWADAPRVHFDSTEGVVEKECWT